MWANESVFYQIYALGFCGAPFENDGKFVSSWRESTPPPKRGTSSAFKALPRNSDGAIAQSDFSSGNTKIRRL